MGKTEYEKAKEIVLQNRGKSRFVGLRSSTLLEKAEQVLGLTFPQTYRSFLADFGAGNFGSFEVYGVVDADFENSSVPDAIWFTLTERREANLPFNLVVIGDAGTGELYCLELGTQTEGRIILLDPGRITEVTKDQIVAEDFGAYFLERVQRQLRR